MARNFSTSFELKMCFALQWCTILIFVNLLTDPPDPRIIRKIYGFANLLRFRKIISFFIDFQANIISFFYGDLGSS